MLIFDARVSEPVTISPFPSDYAPKKDKSSPAYGLVVSEGFWTRWRMNVTQWGYNRLNFFDLMRLYLRSEQPEAPYRDKFYGKDSNGQVRKGFINIDFTTSTTAPKNRSIIQQVVEGSDFLLEVSSLSKEAVNKKTLAKHRLWFDTQGNYLRQQATMQLATSPDAQPIPLRTYYWMPENKQELSMYEKYGGFKLPEETGFTKMVEDSFQRSDWEWIRQEHINRLLETSWCISRIIDNEDGSVGVKYIAIEDYAGAYVDKDNEEPAYEGHFDWVSMECIVPKLKAAYAGITDDQIEQIAFANLRNNTAWNESNFRTPDPVTARMPYYDFMVRVFYFVYKSVDVSGYTEKTKEDGSKVYIEEEDGKSYSAPNKETETYKNCTYYSGTRLINLPYIVDWGPMQNVPKNPDGSPCSPYIRDTTKEKSIVDRWKPWLDSYQMGQLKYRQYLQTMKGDQTVYDVGLMAQMDFGGAKLKGTELIRYANETDNVVVATRGDMAYNKIDPKGAIYNIPRGPNSGLQIAKIELAFIDAEIRNIAGITDAIAAMAAQSPEKLVGVGQQEIAAAGSAMHTLNKVIVRHKKKVGKKIIGKYRVKMEYNPPTVEYLNGVIGEQYVRAILDNEDLTLNQMGITFKVKPSPERKEFIKMLILESMRAGKNGQAGITTSAAAMAEKDLEEGYYERAIWFISLEEERSARRIEANRSAATKETGEVQIASAQAAEEARTRAEAFISELRKTEEGQAQANKLQADLVLQDKEHKDTMAEITLKETFSLQQEHIKASQPKTPSNGN